MKSFPKTRARAGKFPLLEGAEGELGSETRVELETMNHTILVSRCATESVLRHN
jgi:hypothetical protein